MGNRVNEACLISAALYILGKVLSGKGGGVDRGWQGIYNKQCAVIVT